MVEAYRCEYGQKRVDDIGAVEPSTHSDLEYGDLNSPPGQAPERCCSEGFEVGRGTGESTFIDDSLHFRERPGQFPSLNALGADDDPLVEGDDMRRCIQARDVASFSED